MAGISISAIVGDNGIINKAEKAKEETEKTTAQEKLEMELLNLGIDKTRDSNYNSKDYIDKKLVSKGMTVCDNLVVVDGYMFEIDRNTPEIKESRGKGQENNNILINKLQTIKENYSSSNVTLTIRSDERIELISLGGEKLTFSQDSNGKCIINKEVLNNGVYGILVQDVNGGFKIENITIEGLTEDMNIYNKEDMENFRNQVNIGRTFEEKKVQLMDNINLGLTETESWESINGFNGTFLGNDFSISNLYINDTENKENLGLFGTIGSKAIVKELNIITGKINSNGSNVGIIVGKCEGTVEQCKVSCEISGNSYVGGICGSLFDGLIQNSEILNCNVKGTTYIGGICGGNFGKIFNVVSNSNVIISGFGGGGIVGTGTGIIQRASNFGNVEGGSENRRNCWKVS